MLEQAVEDYLDNEVQAAGGETRKVCWLGRRHAPDRFIMLNGKHAFAELKRPGEKPRPGQVREIERIRASGCPVFVADTKESVDRMLERYFK